MTYIAVTDPVIWAAASSLMYARVTAMTPGVQIPPTNRQKMSSSRLRARAASERRQSQREEARYDDSFPAGGVGEQADEGGGDRHGKGRGRDDQAHSGLRSLEVRAEQGQQRLRSVELEENTEAGDDRADDDAEVGVSAALSALGLTSTVCRSRAKDSHGLRFVVAYTPTGNRRRRVRRCLHHRGYSKPAPVENARSTESETRR